MGDQPGILYFTSLLLDGKKYYKIGITKRSSEARHTGLGYKFKTIREIPGTLLECYTLEQSILGMLSNERAAELTWEHLAGYTEVLKLTRSEVDLILQILEEEEEKMDI